MDQMDYKRMVVEAQTMVDEAKNRQKGKSVETEGQSEDDQSRQMDIWEDSVSMPLLTSAHLEVELDNTTNIERAKKRMMRHHWLENTLFFQNLVVLKLAERRMLIEKIHEEIRHFGAMQTFVEVKKKLFWHDKIEAIKKFIKACEKCQLAKQYGNMRFGIEEMKSFLICNLFYHVALDTIGPLPETTNGNKYVLVVIDHYSKLCETQLVKEHDVYILAKFLEDEVIYRYGMPNYILIDNGSEWMKKIVEICQNYGITHQFNAPAWPQCNGIVECLIKTIKHRLTIMATTNIQDWDLLLPRILFGNRCGIQANTKYSPFMVLIGCMPRLTIDNNISGLCDAFDEQENPEVIREQMILKMWLIASVHKTLLENVEHAQRKQRKVYVARKGLQTFEGFIENAKVKMCRPRKKRTLFSNWEGPYFFVEYKYGKGFQEQDHGNRMCILKDLKGQCWEQSRRDLQL